jgi:hypothetical protein
MQGTRTDDQYKKTGIIGDNGTGKSTYLLERVIKPSYNLTTHRILIICDTNPKAYAGITRLTTYDQLKQFTNGIALFWDNTVNPEVMLEKIIDILRQGQTNLQAHPRSPHLHYLHNGAIVFDDCSNYILANPKQVIRTFLGNYRMYCVDLFFIAHSLTDFPSFLRRRMNYFTLYKTLENLTENDLKQFRYPNYQNIFRAWVNRMNHPNRFEPLTIKTAT